jgi:cellobiose-specific phosphotransferase system component IIC
MRRLALPLPDEKKLYDRWKSQAKSIKTIGQMIVGAATVVGVLVVVAIDATHIADGSEGIQGLTADIFAVTAAGLAVAAAFELAYTLYTPGPDEALNPLLLGLSSAFLLLASKDDKLDWQFGFAAAFVAAALYGLFRIRERFALADEDEQDSGSTGSNRTPDIKSGD